MFWTDGPDHFSDGSGWANLAGLAMLRFNSVVVSHDKIDALVVVFGQLPVNEHS
jgi:hypothetical protein